MADDPKARGRAIYEGARYSASGIEMALSVLVGYGIGWWVDGKWGTDPWGMVIGIAFGFAAGVRSLLQAARRIERASAAEEADRDE
ncbi:MAG: AtpZ/AtpI family protein [Myxococcales bacterium]|nr:AtpZ/AtpI family protein [Myxococcales bacterium]MCB9525023.1 AtpZ/AtpI family protein [Myxococcales bacterium]